jgi:circadian clock protein KaiB
VNKNEIPIIISGGKLILQLYVAGMSQRSMEAVENIQKFCSELLEDSFELEIIDLYKHPELAAKQQIIFSPSLIKHFPPPRKTLVGSFSDTDRVIKGLGITIKEQ